MVAEVTISVELLMALLMGALSGLGYGVVWYFLKVADPEVTTPKFKLLKLASTCILGAGIGVLLVITDLPLNDVNFEAKFIIYAGLTASIQEGLKTLYHLVKDWWYARKNKNKVI
jgi:hypothetical protein